MSFSHFPSFFSTLFSITCFLLLSHAFLFSLSSLLLTFSYLSTFSDCSFMHRSSLALVSPSLQINPPTFSRSLQSLSSSCFFFSVFVLLHSFFLPVLPALFAFHCLQAFSSPILLPWFLSLSFSCFFSLSLHFLRLFLCVSYLVLLVFPSLQPSSSPVFLSWLKSISFSYFFSLIPLTFSDCSFMGLSYPAPLVFPSL